MLRTVSMRSDVPPTVTSMRFPFNGLFDAPSIIITCESISDGSDIFALPSIISGLENFTCFDFKNSIFLFTATFLYMDACMAGHTSMGIFAPNATVRTVGMGSSSMPFASLPNVFAVHG